jgi:hypothetical protein
MSATTSKNENADRIETQALISRGRRKDRRARLAIVAKKKNEQTVLAAAAPFQRFIDHQRSAQEGKIKLKDELIKKWTPDYKRKVLEKLRDAAAISAKRPAKVRKTALSA